MLIPRKESNAMKTNITSPAIPNYALKREPLAGMSARFERFCHPAGIQSLTQLRTHDAAAPYGARHTRAHRRPAHPREGS